MRAAAMRGAYVIRCAEGAYVGGSTHIRGRWAQHRCKLRQGKHTNRRLQEAWSRLGESAFSFDVLELSETESLLAVEQRWLDRMNADGSLFNVQLVAGSCAGVIPSVETRAKRAASLRGTVFTPERCARIAAAKRGVKSGSAKITEAQVREIRSRAAGGEFQRVIAADYDISPGSVSEIVNRRTWSHVTDAANDCDGSIRAAERQDPTPPASMARAA